MWRRAPRAAPQSTRILVSSGKGSLPRLSADGRSLFYLNLESRLFEASMELSPTLRVNDLSPLFDAKRFIPTSLSGRNYDVALDGALCSCDARVTHGPAQWL